MESRKHYIAMAIGILLVLPGLCVESTGLLNSVPESPEETLQTGLSVAMLLLFCLVLVGGFIGSAILVFLGWKAASRAVPATRFLRPFLTPLFCAVYLFSLALPFLHTPSGSAIRPMTWAAFSFLLAGVAVFVSLIQVQLNWTRGRNWFGCLFAGIASFGLICVPSIGLGMMALIKGFELKP